MAHLQDTQKKPGFKITLLKLLPGQPGKCLHDHSRSQEAVHPQREWTCKFQKKKVGKSVDQVHVAWA